jgi:DNA-binding winged helix-turn-helix (wHTH) protein
MTVMAFSGFRLDLGAEQLWQGTKQVTVRRKPFAILRYLAANPKRVVTHDELLKEVWGGTVVSESSVRSHLHELRQVLGEGVIETVIGRGYRFTAEPHTDAPPQPAKPSRLVVGRDAELATLRGAIDRARGGHRQVCFVTGEPGIGKTTLVDTFVDELDGIADITIARGQCVEQHGAAEAYMPLFEVVAGVCRALGERALGTLGKRAPAVLAQLPHLVPDAVLADVKARAAGNSETRMVRELADAFDELAIDRTLVIVLEDLQWSDVATLDALSAVAQRRDRARLLVIATSRRAEAQTTTHPLNRIMRPLVARAGAVSIAIERIGAAGIGELLALRFPEHAFPAAFEGLLDRITQGTPLFVASVLDDLVNRGMLAERGGRWELTAALDEIAAHRPESVRQMIDIQLDRLTRDEQRVLEAASLVGIDFSVTTVAAALELSIEAIDDLCDGLARRALFLRREPVEEWPDGTLQPRYAFTHGLVQEVCLERSAPARRQRWHRNIATQLEAAYAGRTDDVSLRLATHFEAASVPARAVHYFMQAAIRAQARFASEDAMHVFRRAEQLVPRISDERERDTLELALLDNMTIAAMRVHTAQPRDPLPSFQRRVELSRRLGDPSRLCAALLDVAQLYLIRAQHPPLVEILAQTEEVIAREQLPPELHIYADSLKAVVAFWHGRLLESRALFERVFATEVPTSGIQLLVQSITGRQSMMLGYVSLLRWMIGEPDRALREVQEAFEIAERTKDPYAIGLAGSMLTWLHSSRRDPIDVIHAAAERIAARPDCAMWHAPVRMLLAWVKSRTTPLSDDEAAQVITAFRERVVHFPLGATTLASRMLGALEGSSRVAEGIAIVDEYIGVPGANGERTFGPDLLRQLGDLERDPDAARRFYERAIAMARENGAVSYELRSAIRIAERCGDRSYLAPALAKLVDGADTTDQRVARELLTT